MLQKKVLKKELAATLNSGVGQESSAGMSCISKMKPLGGAMVPYCPKKTVPAPTMSPALHNSSTLGTKMIHLDSTNHSLIPNMIVLKFISWAELDVIVNCN